VISAVGHESDFTIADFVADCRAPTPSAAAEIVVCTRDSIFEQIAALRAKALQAMRYQLLTAARELHQRGAERTMASIGRALSRRGQRVDDLEYRLRHLQQRALDGQRRRLADLSRRLEAGDLRVRFANVRHQRELLERRLKKALEQKLWQLRRSEERLRAHLEQMSPLRILARGYAIVENEQGQALRSAEGVTAGDPLKILLHEGGLRAVVSATNKHE
jgi:exodeoxyribonuclease VII large subunit